MRLDGHVVRKRGLEKTVLGNGKRQRGRRRLNYMEGLASTMGCGKVEVLQWAGVRIGFRGMAANASP